MTNDHATIAAVRIASMMSASIDGGYTDAP